MPIDKLAHRSEAVESFGGDCHNHAAVHRWAGARHGRGRALQDFETVARLANPAGVAGLHVWPLQVSQVPLPDLQRSARLRDHLRVLQETAGARSPQTRRRGTSTALARQLQTRAGRDRLEGLQVLVFGNSVDERVCNQDANRGDSEPMPQRRQAERRGVRVGRQARHGRATDESRGSRPYWAVS